MKCEACRELLSPFLDGVCGEKENKMIQAHLDACSSCRDQMEEMRRVVELFHHMPLPPLPDGFAESLHRRLDAENLIMFPPHEFKVPRKQGWIAAAIAGVALAGGIYASTVLPLGSMIASWQEKNQEAGKKPNIAVNEVIKRLNLQNVNVADNNTTNNGGQKSTNVIDKPKQTNVVDTPENEATDSNTNSVQPPSSVAQAEQHLADASAIRLTVANASESRKQVLQIASANGLSYSYNNNGCLEPFSGPVAQGVTLQVAPEDADKVMQQLAVLGKAGKPTQGTMDLSDQFKDLQTKMDQAQNEKEKLTAQAALSPQEQDRLNELNTELQSLTDKKAQLDKEASMVFINVYFIEDVNP